MPAQDYFGNGAAILTIDDEHSELVIHARSTVEVRAPDLPMLALSTPWEQVVEPRACAATASSMSACSSSSARRATRASSPR